MSNFFAKADTAVWEAFTPRGSRESQKPAQDSVQTLPSQLLSSIFRKEEDACKESFCFLGRDSLKETEKVKVVRAGRQAAKESIDAQAEAEADDTSTAASSTDEVQAELTVEGTAAEREITLQPKQMAWLGGVSCLASPGALMLGAVMIL